MATEVRVLRAVLGASLVSVVLTATMSTSFAGAWTMEKDEGQAIVTGLYSQASSGFDASGGRTARPDFAKGTGSIYVEYGLLDGLTLVGGAELGSEDDGEGFARPAVSELDLAGRFRLFKNRDTVVSLQVGARIADAFSVTGTEGGRRDRSQIETRALVGRSFELGSWASFVDLEAAYRQNLGTGPNEIRLDATFGTRARPDLLLLAQSFSTLSAGGEAFGGYDYHKVELSAVYDISKRWSVQAGAFATVAGRNALAEQGLISAVWYRF